MDKTDIIKHHSLDSFSKISTMLNSQRRKMKAVHVHIAFNQHGKHGAFSEKMIKFYSTCTCITNLNHHMSDDLTKYLW